MGIFVMLGAWDCLRATRNSCRFWMQRWPKHRSERANGSRAAPGVRSVVMERLPSMHWMQSG